MTVHVAKLTSKGQITIPVGMRRRLGLAVGSRLVFEEQPNGNFVVRKKTGDIRDLKALLPKPKRALSIDEMDEAIAAAVIDRLDRGR